MKSEYNVRLNFKRAVSVNTGWKFSAGDKGIAFVISVEELDTTDTTARIVFRRANGTSVESEITGTDGVYTYTTLGNEFAVPGKTIADVKFYEDDSKRISTATFVFEVGTDTMDGIGAGTGGYSDRLEQVVKEAEEAQTEAKETQEEMKQALQNFKEQYGAVGALSPKGEWTSDATYQIRDMVFHEDVAWVALSENQNVVPSAKNAAIWMPMFDLSEYAKVESVQNIQTTSKATLSQAGWYRVAEYVTNNASDANGNRANACKLSIKVQGTYSNYYELLLSSIYGLQEFEILKAKSLKSHRFTKARYTVEGNIAYLEVYQATTNAFNVLFAIDAPKDYLTYWQAITPTLTEETVDGVTVTTTYDIPANASPLTSEGGDINGHLRIFGDRVVQFYKPDGSRSFALYASASAGYGIHSSMGQDWVMLIPDNGGTPTFNGTASGNLPLNVGAGNTQIRTTGNVPVFFKTTTNGGLLLGFADESGTLGYLGIGTKHNPVYAVDGIRYSLHHDGNSAKVHIGTSAPTDTTALWVDTSNKVVKAYIDGAWTQVS